MGRLHRDLRDTRRVVMAVSMAGKTAATGRMRGVGIKVGGKSARSGLRMPNARFDIKGSQNPTSLLKATGVAHWWERGTQPHTLISRKYGGSRKSRGAIEPRPGMWQGKRRRGAIRTPMGPRAHARHPGQRATPFWADTVNDTKKAAGPIMRADTQSKLIRSFR
jgi:hypothetical protein